MIKSQTMAIYLILCEPLFFSVNLLIILFHRELHKKFKKNQKDTFMNKSC